MNIQHEYETTYLIKPELPDDAVKAVLEKVTGIIENHSGSILLTDDWGKRKLAYPIQKHTRGHYFYVSYVSGPDLIAELERNLRIDDNLLRFLTVKVGDDVDVEARRVAAAEVAAKRAEERAAREAEEAARAAAEAEAEAERAARAAKAAERAAAAEAAAAAETAEAAEAPESTEDAAAEGTEGGEA